MQILAEDAEVVLGEHTVQGMIAELLERSLKQPTHAQTPAQVLLARLVTEDVLLPPLVVLPKGLPESARG